MTNNSVHSHESKLVIVPRSGSCRGGLVLALLAVIPLMVILGLTILVLVVTAGRLSKPVTLPPPYFLLLACVSGFALLAVGVVGLLDANNDRVLGYNTLKDEIVLAERFFGQEVFRRPYACANVTSIRIHWQATYTGGEVDTDPEYGWWMARLRLVDGNEVHLHGIRGKPDALPDEWLTRFAKAGRLIGKPLEIAQFTSDIEAMSTYAPPVGQITTNLRRQPVWLRGRIVSLLILLLLFWVGLIVILLRSYVFAG